MMRGLCRCGSNSSTCWSVSWQWLRSSSESPSEYSRTSASDLQFCRFSRVSLRSTSPLKARDRAAALLTRSVSAPTSTRSRRWSSRALLHLRQRQRLIALLLQYKHDYGFIFKQRLTVARLCVEQGRAAPLRRPQFQSPGE